MWCRVDRLEQSGEITALEARRWKYEIFSVMLERGLEPDGLVRIVEEPVPASVEALESYRFRRAQLASRPFSFRWSASHPVIFFLNLQRSERHTPCKPREIALKLFLRHRFYCDQLRVPSGKLCFIYLCVINIAGFYG